MDITRYKPHPPRISPNADITQYVYQALQTMQVYPNMDVSLAQIPLYCTQPVIYESSQSSQLSKPTLKASIDPTDDGTW